MKIEVLYFDGCPNHDAAVEGVREVLEEERVAAEVIEVNVADAAKAQAAGFLGSPTIRINGLDIEPAARSGREPGMSCRIYLEEGKREGIPSPNLVRAAVKEALAIRSSSTMNIKSESSCRSSATQSDLVRPGWIGFTARVAVSLVMLSLAALGARVGGAWLIPALGAGTLGILIALAAMLKQPGCEVNLIWQRLLGKTPIACFLFGPIDRWEQNKCK